MTIDVPGTSGNAPTRAEVWYPTEPVDTRQTPTETTYDLKEWLPPAQRKALGTRSAPKLTTGAVRGGRAAPGGPFPVVAFSHGFGGFRVQSAFLMTHLATWGFVVVAPDHPSRGMAALLSGKLPLTGTADVDDLRSSVLALSRSNLRSRLDLSNMAAIGHSAGANAAIRWAANEPRVQGIVAMAGGVSRPFSKVRDALRPILYLAAVNDRTIGIQSMTGAYRSSESPKRLITVKDSGHLAFSDICTIAADRGGLFMEAERLGLKVPVLLKTLGTDGCNPPNAPVTKAWPVIESSVVAELRAVFGSGTPGFGLDQGTLDTLASRGAVRATFTIG